MPLWNVPEPGPGRAGGCDGGESSGRASQGRYSVPGTHMVSDNLGFQNRGFCTFSTILIKRESVKKYIYCMDRMYDIYNKILRLIFTVYTMVNRGFLRKPVWYEFMQLLSANQIHIFLIQ